jgi:uncharacterized protein
VTLSASDRYDALCERLAAMGSVLVAYSGGVDSTLLAVAARDALGDRSLCVLATSGIYARSEIEDARTTADALALNFLEVEVDALDSPAFATNPPDRCYHCKLAVFGRLRAVARERKLAFVVDGSNADDASDHRPGSRAASELGVESPLRGLALTKADIRAISRDLGLPTADKPSMACLASRFPYGDAIDAPGLARVAAAEDALHALGLRQFRVRSHGDVARLEVEPVELDAAWTLRPALSLALKAAGFAYSTLDLDGYRTGSLNETLSEEERT